MKFRTASRIATGVLYASLALVPVSLTVSTPAHAETVTAPSVTSQTSSPSKAKTPRWTKHDKKVMKQANKTCDAITDDVTWEFCVIGAFHLNDSGSKRVITSDDYKVNNKGQIVLVQR